MKDACVQVTLNVRKLFSLYMNFVSLVDIPYTCRIKI